jgi:hypothetical protein
MEEEEELYLNKQFTFLLLNRCSIKSQQHTYQFLFQLLITVEEAEDTAKVKEVTVVAKVATLLP